jgi:hypothetical protein
MSTAQSSFALRREAKPQIIGKGFTRLRIVRAGATIGAFATVPIAVKMISQTRHHERRA